jgi:hypothetical protein
MQVRRSVWLPVRHRFLLTVLLSIAAVLGSAFTVWAQGSYRAQLRGVVSDPSGAAVNNAAVTIQNVGTNISSTARTNDKG